MGTIVVSVLIFMMPAYRSCMKRNNLGQTQSILRLDLFMAKIQHF